MQDEFSWEAWRRWDGSFDAAGGLGESGFGGSAGDQIDGLRISTARIVITSNTTCEIFWDTGGGSTAEGICMRNGPAFTAAYVMGNAIGLVIYEILPDGTLDGLWTVAGQRGNGTEVLTPR